MTIETLQDLGFNINAQNEVATLILSKDKKVALQINSDEELSLIVDGLKSPLNTQEADVINIISAFKELFKDSIVELPF